MSDKKEYIGDGVYAEMSGYMIKLTTERGGGVLHVIYLEPEVYASLVEYAKRVWKLAGLLLFVFLGSTAARAAGPEAALQGAVKPLPAELQSHTKENAVRDQIKQDVKDAIKEARADAVKNSGSQSFTMTPVIIVKESSSGRRCGTYTGCIQPIPYTDMPPSHYSWESAPSSGYLGD